MNKYSFIIITTLLLCTAACSEDRKPISVDTTYIPPKAKLVCEPDSHIVGESCVKDTVQACGADEVDCTKLPGWVSGTCINGLCAAEQCAPLHHIQNGICAYDTDDCCGNECTVCEPGSVCSFGVCTSTCDASLTYCQNGCFDLTNAVQHCGSCDINCNDFLAPNAQFMQCADSKCEIILCKPGYKLQNQQCVPLNNPGPITTSECQLGQTKPCFTGDPKAENVGACHAGYYNCIQSAEGSFVWDESTCIGEVIPTYNFKCETADQDLDCNGLPDSLQDEDGDGYTVCSLTSSAWDCCDNPKMCNTIETAFVHPGQTGDCYGNSIDDNCNGKVDESPEIACSAGFAACAEYNDLCEDNITYSHGTTVTAVQSDAIALAQAMDLCLPIVEQSSNQPGIIEYSISQADNVSTVDAYQINIIDAMRDISGTPLVFPQNGNRFMLLSTGVAEDVYERGETDYENYDASTVVGVTPPDVYKAVHGTYIKTHDACDGNESINDSVKLHFKLRAPESANGFKFDFRFFTHEYPSFVCSAYNDIFIAILTDEAGNPLVDINKNGSLADEDGNITFDSLGNPISVNTSLFSTCKPISCSDESGCPKSMTCGGTTCNQCIDGAAEVSAFSYSNEGGATGWLTTSAPITPGTVFNLDFYIWDTGDSIYDSTVIIDNFRWTCATQVVETGYAKPKN